MNEELEENENIKFNIIRIVISVVLLIITKIIIPARLSICFYIASYLLVGFDILIKSIKNIFKGKVFDENFLMSVATIGAFLINEPLEANIVIIFYKIGELLEDYSVDKSKKSIFNLINIKPKIANLKVDGNIVEIEPEKLKIGDIIIVKAGEKIPIDGIILNGNSSINTSSLTGESIPKNVKDGDEVLAGTINELNPIEIKVTKEFKDTEINRIIELIKNANSTKSRTEIFITKFAKIYTPIVVGLAVIMGVGIPLIFGEFNIWVKRALIFLVTSCPCALVISVPLGYFAGIGKASKNKLIVKGSNYLDMASNTSAIVLDKTGTITKGSFEISKIILEDNVKEEELLDIIYISESMSNHPIARGIIRTIKKVEVQKNSISNYEELAGLGIKLKYNNDEIVIGNENLLKKENISYKECIENGVVIYVAKNKEFLGVIVLEDTLKEESKIAINNFKKNGINNIYMLTGDNKNSAKNIAKEVNIDNSFYELLPHEKVEKLQEIKEKEKIVIAVGDGINDAPCLALADIGISIGNTGSDLAIENSDIVIMDGNLNRINDLIKIAKTTKKISKQNMCLAIVIKVLVLALGTLGMANMWQAIFADVGVTIITILNSVRIFK